MNDINKLDLNDPYLRGLYYELNEEGSEFLFPPSKERYQGFKESDNLDDFNETRESCSNKVIITENGNQKYAWFYINNNSEQHSNVTIEKSWIYNGVRRKETMRMRLYPGERRNVFNMPRKQDPRCGIIVCDLEPILSGQ